MNPEPTPTAAQTPVRAAPRPERTVLVHPRVDVHEGEADWLLLADLPGVAPGDVTVRTERDEIQIAATGVALDGTKVTFRRNFQLARGTAVDAIRAELKDGVLTVTLPKLAEVRSRVVPVTTLDAKVG